MVHMVEDPLQIRIHGLCRVGSGELQFAVQKPERYVSQLTTTPEDKKIKVEVRWHIK